VDDQFVPTPVMVALPAVTLHVPALEMTVPLHPTPNGLNVPKKLVPVPVTLCCWTGVPLGQVCAGLCAGVPNLYPRPS
jgi:hypothetical protein